MSCLYKRTVLTHSPIAGLEITANLRIRLREGHYCGTAISANIWMNKNESYGSSIRINKVQGVSDHQLFKYFQDVPLSSFQIMSQSWSFLRSKNPQRQNGSTPPNCAPRKRISGSVEPSLQTGIKDLSTGNKGNSVWKLYGFVEEI